MISKKGRWEELEFEPIFSIFLILVVFASLMSWVLVVVPGKQLYEKNIVARDIGLVIDAVQSVPGDVRIIYDKTGSFSYAFTNRGVEVFDERKALNPPVRSRGRGSFHPSLMIKKPDVLRPLGVPVQNEKEPTQLQLQIVKKGGGIFIGDEKLQVGDGPPRSSGVSPRGMHVVVVAEHAEALRSLAPYIDTVTSGLRGHRVFGGSTITFQNYETELLGERIDMAIVFAVGSSTEVAYATGSSALHKEKQSALARTLLIPVRPVDDASLVKPHPLIRITLTGNEDLFALSKAIHTGLGGIS